MGEFKNIPQTCGVHAIVGYSPSCVIFVQLCGEDAQPAFSEKCNVTEHHNNTLSTLAKCCIHR